MALNIKDPSTEQSVRELAAATGEGLTATVRRAVEERLARLRREKGRDLLAEIKAISDHFVALPDLDPRSDEELVGYDENGAPT
jgi:antitoxin VapB